MENRFGKPQDAERKEQSYKSSYQCLVSISQSVINPLLLNTYAQNDYSLGRNVRENCIDKTEKMRTEKRMLCICVKPICVLRGFMVDVRLNHFAMGLEMTENPKTSYKLE